VTVASSPSSTTPSASVTRFLRTFQFRVEAFASAEEFLRSSRLASVGCVILDLAMPQMSGLEVQQQLAARGLQIPTVFVRVHRDDHLGHRASAAGALAVLRKPVDDEELVRSVRKTLGQQREAFATRQSRRRSGSAMARQ
jgi:FixJ family two-component response regulator